MSDQLQGERRKLIAQYEALVTSYRRSVPYSSLTISIVRTLEPYTVGRTVDVS